MKFKKAVALMRKISEKQMVYKKAKEFVRGWNYIVYDDGSGSVILKDEDKE